VVHRVLCASNNPKKIRELTSILLRVSGASVATPTELGIELEVEETGTTFAANATLKAEAFSRVSGLLTVADDSGLVVDALNGAPGIYSARYGGPGHSDDDRNALVLAEMEEVPDMLRSARFLCAIAVTQQGHETQIFEGAVEGSITRRPIGRHGFGYDPIFYYAPFERTFGEVDADLKATVSHRGKALRQAAPFLRSLLAGDILEQC
jgi:XTP/dITP diphosphohydrolase